MANPLVLACLVTIVVMVIVTFSFDQEHKLRTTIRVFVTVTAFMFINNHIMLDEKHCAMLNNEQRDVLRIISGTDKSQMIRPSPAIAGGDVEIIETDDLGDDGMIIEGRPEAD